MRATRTWADITARPVSSKVHEWILDLVERWGDDRVADAITNEGRLIAAGGSDFGRLLTRTRDRLAREEASTGARPTFVDREWLLAIARGERPEPEGLFWYDTADLSRDEYGELLTWATAKRDRTLTRHLQEA